MKYYIQKNTGEKAILSSKEGEFCFLRKKGGNSITKTWKDVFEKDWMPITKAEYESDITREEIKAVRNNSKSLEVGGSHYQQPIQVWDFDGILKELSSIHSSKNHDYGNSFEELFDECGFVYAYGHLKEKLNRIKTLMNDKNQVKNESIEDSLLDLANYAILTLMEVRKRKEHG